MGIKSLEKMTPTYETPSEILELVRTSVLETLQPDFYHNQDEHAKAAIQLHRLVATKYPNFYVDVFSDSEFTNYFLDAHKIMSLPYLLQHKENVDVVVKNLLSLRPERLEDAYRICRMKDTFGVSVPVSILRKLFEVQSKHIESEKGKDYIGYLAAKYSAGLKSIMATAHAKRESLTPAWKDAMEWVFNKNENATYLTRVLNEAALLRKAVKEGKELDFLPTKVPFTVWQGYAKALGFSEKDIFKEYGLMTKNEVRRYLNTLQKYGVLEDEKAQKKVEEKVMKTATDLLQLFYGIKVLDKKAKDILMKKGKQEFEHVVTGMKQFLKDKTISIAIDCSGGCAGHSELLSSSMQKKITAGERVPKWASIVQRETFNANVLVGKILADAARTPYTYLFNESVEEVALPATFEELVEELKSVKCSGGSNVLEATMKAISVNPDIAFVVTDMNENIPFMGALKAKLAKLASEFNGTLVFVVTETIVERPEAVLLDELIKGRKLLNVFIVPVHQMDQLEKGFMLLKLLEKAKEVFIKTRKKVKA